MKRKLVFFVGMMILLCCLNIPMLGNANSGFGPIHKTDRAYPENTVILGNEIDVRFSQDFSILLKHLRLDWFIMDRPMVPDAIQDKNIILLGHPDNGTTGELIREILTEEEIKTFLQSTDQYILLEKQSPWMAERKIFICSGADTLQRRNAVEVIVRKMIDDAPPASGWIQSSYDFEISDGFRDYISQLQYRWEDTELPLVDLMLDVDAKSPLRITQKQAMEDVDRLFYLLSHGYSGYAFFNQDGEFGSAQSNILQELSSKSYWSKNTLSELINEHLSFILDCHFRIDDYQFVNHHDFWYDTQLELHPENEGYQFYENNRTYTVLSINGGAPAQFLFPSLNQAGEPIYRIGLLSIEKPPSFKLIAINEENEQQFDINLQRSEFDYYMDEIFREDLMGGIPVIRVRSFGDSYPDELNKFVETAKNHRGEPVMIVDIRGNGGGNEKWPLSWLQGLTGRRAEAVFTTSELESKTSLSGRANAFIYWDSIVSDSTLFSSYAKLHTQKAERFEVGQRQPTWTNAQYPISPLISNDTIVILITNNLVASAGEGLVLRSSQVENVMVVGENTMGCLTFGNISLHQLPYSKIKVWMPINFCVFSDQEFREGIGLAPDLWVPAKDAVNYTIEAIRQGTITTSIPFPEDILAQEFKPESPWRRVIEMNPKSWLVIGAFTLGGAMWAYLLRKKTSVLLMMGVGWITVSLYWNSHKSEKFIGYGFFMIGVVWLIWGVIKLVKANKLNHQSDPLLSIRGKINSD